MRIILPLYKNKRRGAPTDYFTKVGVVASVPGQATSAVITAAPVAALQKNLKYSSTNFITSTISRELLVKNQERQFLMVYNTDTVIDVFINFGVPADSSSMRLPAGATITLDWPNAPNDAVFIVAASGTPTVYAVEGI